MKDEEILKLLEMTVNSEHSPEISDEVADAILSRSEECPPEKTARLRGRFVEKVILTLHPRPVREVDAKWPLGRWFEAIRESLCLTREDIAAALGKEVIFVERLERGEVQPWECDPDDVAELMRLFRLHSNAASQLVNNSAAVNQARDVRSAAARSRGGHASSERGESTRRALEMFLAHNAAPAKPDATVSEWLDALREALRRRGLNELLD
jgi:transcriptional regulator with XRE-family HTH domain